MASRGSRQRVSSSVPSDGGSSSGVMWPSWARGGRRPSATPTSSGGAGGETEDEGTCIPLADLRSTMAPVAVADAAASDSGTRLVSAHPTRVMPHKDHDHHDHHPVTPAQDKLGSDRVSADVVSSASSVSPSDRASWPSSGPRPLVSIGTIQSGDTPGGTTLSEAKFFSSEELRPGRSEPDSPTPPEPLVVENGRQESVVPSSAGDVSGGQQQYRDGSSSAAVAINPGDYMRSIAAEARAWSARALASSAAARDDVDPVTMLLPDGAMGQRVGGSTGRGPLLRRLQTPAPGMLDDFVVVTITCPGPLFVRLRPDPRGLVVVNNFDDVPDDPHTGCPRLGPIERVGTVMPGDALVSVNRDVLIGRPFSACVRYIREACSATSTTSPCLLCFRRADSASLEGTIGAPPRSLEEEKRRSLEQLLKGGEGGLLDEAKLRGIASTGVPDAGGLRPVLWRFLLRSLPINCLQWPEHLRTQRELYARFVRDLILKPTESVTKGGGSGVATRCLDPPVNGAAPEKSVGTAPASTDERGSSQESCAQAPAVVSRVVGSCVHGDDSPPVNESTMGDVKTLQCDGSNGQSFGTFMNGESTAPTSASSSASRPPSGAGSGLLSRLNRELLPTDDDPLSNKETSEWAALWSDKELMQAIDQDVVRTMPDLAFYACRSIEDDSDDDGDSSSVHYDGRSGSGDGGSDETYADKRRKVRAEQRRRGRERRLAVSRILFVHAKLNPAESYTQGMNEIVATLYFVLATDTDEEWSEHCEADTFFCFTNLMSEIRDVFISSLDDSESGLHGKMEAFSRTLRQHDPELAQHMVGLALDPRYFALRWFTTLLSREFDLPDTIRLWDSLFASQNRSTFLVFVFVTLLLAQREALLAGDFSSNLQLLQAYPPTDVPEILAQSEALLLFSARGNAARAGGLREQRAREAAEGATQVAEQVNAAAKRFWSAATDLAAGAAERMVAMNENAESYHMHIGGRVDSLGNGVDVNVDVDDDVGESSAGRRS